VSSARTVGEIGEPGALTAWLDENCGGVLNDALSIYFANATLANAFVARSKVEATGGVFQVREDETVRGSGRDCTGPHERQDPQWNAERLSGWRSASTAVWCGSRGACSNAYYRSGPFLSDA